MDIAGIFKYKFVSYRDNYVPQAEFDNFVVYDTVPLDRLFGQPY